MENKTVVRHIQLHLPLFREKCVISNVNSDSIRTLLMNTELMSDVLG